AGYLPPQGRIYLPLGPQAPQPLMLRWHHHTTGEQQQQTIEIDSDLYLGERQTRYFMFVLKDNLFIQQGED
ncbi:MAG: hypothetical protein R6X06_02955, partial [Gammaproteobacteria bacterium]